ncbi:MAG: glycerate kinase [Planctomycetaceae bacterium]|nr:glycerate kinase [Planctomycetaceae bacterium]
MSPPTQSRQHANSIWSAAVAVVRPEPLVESAVGLIEEIRNARRVLVVGAGKAGAGMAFGLEAALAEKLGCVEGLVNVPAGMTAPLKRIRLHPARPQGVNEPTAEGVAGAEEMLRLLASSGPEDVAVCLLSGGGSALLPAPETGITLADKLAVTKLLHRSGATIDEMNCVRKHLSRVKGGRLAEAFQGKLLVSLIMSDVVGDPLDVIASGPTAPDPTTFAEALDVLKRYGLLSNAPPSIVSHLEGGRAGKIAETPKAIPANIVNQVIGSNRVALNAASQKAKELGYRVLDLGAFIEGETHHTATAVAGVVRSIRVDATPVPSPACILIGGETTVSLGEKPGKGGRNQEFVLAMIAKLGLDGMKGVTVLSGGTDGEDGPTDAAGAVADAETILRFQERGISPQEHLERHDAYSCFEKVQGLLKTGLTGTNVMDIRVVLIHGL